MARRATQNDGPTVTFTASGTVTQWALVKIVAASATDPVQVIETTGVAGEDGTVIGIAQETVATGLPVAVRMLNAVATAKCIADLADIAVGDVLYTAANGEVTDAITSGMVVGIALQASAAALDLIEVAVAPSFEAAGVT